MPNAFYGDNLTNMHNSLWLTYNKRAEHRYRAGLICKEYLTLSQQGCSCSVNHSSDAYDLALTCFNFVW